MGTRARLFLADDQSLFLSGLEALLSTFGEYEIAGKARTGSDVLAIVPGLALDAILLDIGLPDRSGVDVAGELRAMGVTAPILIVSNYDSRHCVVTAVKAHVQGYLLKDADAETLRRAIAAILAGKRFIDDRLLGFLLDELQGVDEDAPSGTSVAGSFAAEHAGGAYGLTPRELDVLRLMATGLSNNEIARALYLSPKTARNHTTNIFQKMGVSDRTKAVVIALAQNMVQTDGAGLRPVGGSPGRFMKLS